MSIVLEIVLPVFGIVLMGFFATKLGWFNETAEQGVNHFTFNFAVPLMLFNILSQISLPEEPPIPFLASFFGPLFIVAFCGYLISRYIFKRSYSVGLIAGFCGAFGNTALLGLPLLLIAFGEERILPFYIILSVHGLTLFTILTILLEFGEKKASKDENQPSVVIMIVKSLLTNPILVAIIVGMVCNLLEVSMPKAVLTLTGLMKGAVIPAALFVLGASLTRYGIRGRVMESSAVVILKIVVFPFLVYISGTYIFEIDPFWVMVAVITAAQPPGVMSFMFATRYKVGVAVASTSIFMAAAGSVVTITWILYFFNVR